MSPFDFHGGYCHQQNERKAFCSGAEKVHLLLCCNRIAFLSALKANVFPPRTLLFAPACLFVCSQMQQILDSFPSPQSEYTQFRINFTAICSFSWQDNRTRTVDKFSNSERNPNSWTKFQWLLHTRMYSMKNAFAPGRLFPWLLSLPQNKQTKKKTKTKTKQTP